MKGRRLITWAGVMALVVLSAVLRLCGSGWGVTQIPPALEYHSDERRIVQTAARVSAGHKIVDHYPAGLAVQAGLLSRAAGLGASSWDRFLLPTRWLSVAYGVLAVALTLLLARDLGLRGAGWWFAGIAAATSGLMCVYSHYATADIGNAFWLTACMWASLRAWRSGRWAPYAAALACAGLALAFKLSWMALLPPFAAARLKRGRWIALALAPAVMYLVFETANLWQFSGRDFEKLWLHVKNDNLLSPEDHNFTLNPFIFAAQALAGLGLPVFVLALAGLGMAARRGSREWDRGVVFTVALPVAAVLASACALSVPFARHIMPALPALCVAAGFAWGAVCAAMAAHGRGALAHALLLLLVAYQAAYAAGVQRPYVEDTRAEMAAWMRRSFPPEREVFVSRIAEKYDWTGLLTSVPELTIDRTPYVLLHEYYYRRYLRSIFNPLENYPPERRVYHPIEGHLPFIQALFRGEAPYREIKRCRVRYFTPELMLYQRFWGAFPDFVGDTVLFEKVTRR